ncbi:MAG: response regulator [Phycisphaerae bacterium]
MPAPTILLVDDELENMSDHVRQLQNNGYVVTSFRTTDQAVDEFMSDRSRIYDLVILDMMIPPPDGERYNSVFEAWDGLRSGGHLLHILREKHDDARPPVLLLSNLADEEVLIEAWDRFVIWADKRKSKLALPSARNVDAMASALQTQFGTWVHGKRRTPPWHLPKLAQQILGVG